MKSRTTVVVAEQAAQQYTPGSLRSATDHERERVDVFLRRHPGYERLGYEGLKQVAAGYLDDEDLAVRGELRAVGVDARWRTPRNRDGEYGGFLLAEDLL